MSNPVTARRIMGIETEYGILQRGNPYANPMLMSSQIVLAYKGLQAEARTRWDYLDEDPLSDARGFRLPRASAHPSLLTDDPDRPAPSGDAASASATNAARITEIRRPAQSRYDDPGAANAILTNGARLYVDHAHPEYSSPEITNAIDAVTWDVAGERVMLAASRAAAVASGTDITLYKNNVDGKGASYGTHENFQVDRKVPFSTIVDVLTPFLVTRQIFTGSGRVGIGQAGAVAGFQLSQRADYMEAEVGLETTLNRPIINTRDEPHADRERWRRLHVIIGDANLFEVATYLKLGTTSLVLWLIEHLDTIPGAHEALAGLRLVDPVSNVQVVSCDLALTTPLRLCDGRELTALEIQREYLAVVKTAMSSNEVADDGTLDIIEKWQSVLDRLAIDPALCSAEVEWVAKLQLLTRMREREFLDWDHPRIIAMDIQWSDTRPERSIYAKLLKAGRVERVTTDEAVAAAVRNPPQDTRAYFRGSVIEKFSDEVSAASWDSVIFDVPGYSSLRRVPMPDASKGTAAHVGKLIAESASAGDLLMGLQG